MSDSLSKPWIADYLLSIARTLGAHPFSEWKEPCKNKKVQLIDFLTYQQHSQDDTLWGIVSDQQYAIPVRFSKNTLYEYTRTSSGSRLTEHKGAVIRISCMPLFARTPVGKNIRRMTAVENLALEIMSVRVIGSSGEALFGVPMEVAEHRDLKEWVGGLRKGGGSGNVLKARYEEMKSASPPAPPAECTEINGAAVLLESRVDSRRSGTPAVQDQRHQSSPSTPSSPPDLPGCYEDIRLTMTPSPAKPLVKTIPMCTPPARRFSLASSTATPKPHLLVKQRARKSALDYSSTLSSPQPRQTTPEAEEWPPSQGQGSREGVPMPDDGSADSTSSDRSAADSGAEMPLDGDDGSDPAVDRLCHSLTPEPPAAKGVQAVVGVTHPIYASSSMQVDDMQNSEAVRVVHRSRTTQSSMPAPLSAKQPRAGRSPFQSRTNGSEETHTNASRGRYLEKRSSSLTAPTPAQRRRVSNSPLWPAGSISPQKSTANSAHHDHLQPTTQSVPESPAEQTRIELPLSLPFSQTVSLDKVPSSSEPPPTLSHTPLLPGIMPPAARKVPRPSVPKSGQPEGPELILVPASDTSGTAGPGSQSQDKSQGSQDKSQGSQEKTKALAIEKRPLPANSSRTKTFQDGKERKDVGTDAEIQCLSPSTKKRSAHSPSPVSVRFQNSTQGSCVHDHEAWQQPSFLLPHNSSSTTSVQQSKRRRDPSEDDDSRLSSQPSTKHLKVTVLSKAIKSSAEDKTQFSLDGSSPPGYEARTKLAGFSSDFYRTGRKASPTMLTWSDIQGELLRSGRAREKARVTADSNFLALRPRTSQ